MKRKTFSEADILEIDDCAPSMTDMPGVLQVFAGYGRSMNRLPDISQDGSLIVLIDVADTFVRRCFDIFDVRKFPCEYASTVPPPDKVEKVSKSAGLSLSKRSVMRFKISKIGSFLSSGYRVVLQMTVGGSILNFAEYDVASPPEIFAALRTALRG